MKYWQEDRFQKPNKTNVPHLYAYTWIRASCSVAFIFNSILMFLVVKENIVFEQTPAREGVEYIFYIILGILNYSTVFSIRKCGRTLSRLIADVFMFGLFSMRHVLDNRDIIYLYIIEIIFIVYYAIKIDKDNDIVDKNRFVVWWKQKKRERFLKKIEKHTERNRKRREQLQVTPKVKKKHLSRRERKQINMQKNNR